MGGQILATLKDIGSALGLSAATVSRALNGYPEVNARTRALVEDMAARLHYRPNQIAQKLVTGRSGMVGIIPCQRATEGNSEGYLAFLLGVSERLAANDIDLVVHVAASGDDVAPYRRMVEKQVLEGVIVTAPIWDDARVAYLVSEGMPVVVHGRAGQHVTYPSYDVDHFGVAERGVALLYDLGHRQIALVNGGPAFVASAEFAAGFETATSARRLSLQPSLLTDGGAGEEHGYLTALQALGGASGPSPTAFLCAWTSLAAGV